MIRESLREKNYDNAIEIAEGIYWVGYFDDKSGLHCNPYLIVEGDESVLIDGGSRPDFSSVMMKILRIIEPKKIKRLIYQHYDPDLCGSIPHLEDIIENPELKIISHHENNVFIKYYSVTSPRLCIEQIDYEYTFDTGRKLRFIRTPYAHSAGSFVTFDEKTGTLLSSDIFGSHSHDWNLFLDLDEECASCDFVEDCPLKKQECPIKRILGFHIRIMTSEKAMRYAINQLKDLPIKMIAPQHGSVIYKENDIASLMKRLCELKGVGIDAY